MNDNDAPFPLPSSVPIALAGDHAGFGLKQQLAEHLRRQGRVIVDLGTVDEQSVDYPDFGARLARSVLAGATPLGIAICGTGIGISIAANRHRGIRAALCRTVEEAALAREHNNANVLVLGGRITPAPEARAIVDSFLATPFAGGRHQRRIDQLDRLPG